MREVQDNMWPLVAKYITDEASEEERTFIEQVLKENEEISSLYEQLFIVYQTTEKFERANSTDAFSRLHTRITKANIL
jgi:tRNA C32,U32 (ribose-2'-O)-methylase TrmJ